MKKKKRCVVARGVRNVDDKDRLSELPDSILILVLSSLDNTRTAVQTCLLSKRWYNSKLWRYLHNLNFTNLTFGKRADKYETFVHEVLLRRDSNVKLHLFSFRWLLRKTIPQTLLDRIHTYAQSHHVQQFNLCIGFPCAWNREAYPTRIFNPQSLTTLRLNLCNWNDCFPLRDGGKHGLQQLYLDGLTSLETLSLESFRIIDLNFSLDMFSRFTKLKDLSLVGCNFVGKEKYLIISAPRLERLILLDKLNKDEQSTVGNLYGIQILSSTLKYLRIDLWTNVFTTCNMSSLEELEVNVHTYNIRAFDFYLIPIDALFVRNLISVLENFSHATSVTFSNTILQVLSSIPDILKSEPPSCPQLKWKRLKVKTTTRFPPTDYPKYHCGLAYLRSCCLENCIVNFI